MTTKTRRNQSGQNPEDPNQNPETQAGEEVASEEASQNPEMSAAGASNSGETNQNLEPQAMEAVSSAETTTSPEPQTTEANDPSLEAGIDRLVEIIDRTVEQFSGDPSERDSLREGITSVIRETMQELALGQNLPNLQTLPMGTSGTLESLAMGSGNLENMQMGSGGGQVAANANAAIGAASAGAAQVGASFVQFTEGLVTGTFKAIIDATIQQMQAYTAMVAELTKSLKDFASSNVDDGAVTSKLAELTFTENSAPFAIQKDQPRRLYHLKRLHALAPQTGDYKQKVLAIYGITGEDVAAKLNEYETGKDKEGNELAAEKSKDGAAGIKVAADTSGKEGKYSEADILTLQEAVKLGLAKDGLNQLRQMAREGMARIIVTEGEINTKLTFSVKSDATAVTNTNTENRTSSGVNTNVSGSAGWGWGRVNASVSANYDNLSVNTVSENAVSNINTSTDMLGEVRLKFKTDYQPLNKSTEVSDEALKPIS